MDKGNVLVIGNSGVGKSTLINAVLGEDVAKTGWGTEGTTKELEIYEGEYIPFRIIDTVGFEPSFIKRHNAIKAVKSWCRQSAKNDTNPINVIWFCVDGTSRKLFLENIKSLAKSVSVWKSVPIVVVITKSYSIPEADENIKMVQEAFEKHGIYKENLRDIIPVVSSPYVLDNSTYITPRGITQLIDTTYRLLPEGMQSAEQDIFKFKLGRKRALAQSVVGISTTAGAVVGAVPMPITDSAILTPIEVAEINAIAQIYGINNGEGSRNFINSIIEAGTVSVVARATLNALKSVPGINLTASVMNAIIAGCFVAAVGEGAIYAFEQVFVGNKSVMDTEWVKAIIESKISAELIERARLTAKKADNSSNSKDIGKLINDIFNKK